MDSFKYLGLEIPSDHKWHRCATKRRENDKRAYYNFENMCKQADVQSWQPIEVWGGSLSKDKWNDIKKVQKLFITNFLAVRRTTPYPILLLEIGSLP